MSYNAAIDRGEFMENQPKISRWVAFIEDSLGHERRLKILSDLFPEHLQFSATWQRFYLTDSILDSSKSADEAFAYFETLLFNIALACNDVLTTDGLLVNVVHPVYEDGSLGRGHHVIKPDNCTIRVIGYPVRIITGDPEEAYRRIREEQLNRLQLVKENPCVAYVLKTLKKDTKPLDGFTLRMVYEAIIANCPGKKHSFEQQYKAVKDTLNYYHCHPSEFTNKPKPAQANLTLEECESKVRELAEVWIEHLLSQKQACVP